MILSDKTIMKMLEERTLFIEPLDPRQIQPASVNIRLDSTFSVLENTPSGIITLELFNANRCAIELKADRRMGQPVFAHLDDTALRPYRGKYQGQKGLPGLRCFWI